MPRRLKNVVILLEWTLPTAALVTVNQLGEIVSLDSSSQPSTADAAKSNWMEDAYRGVDLQASKPTASNVLPSSTLMPKSEPSTSVSSQRIFTVAVSLVEVILLFLLYEDILG